MAQTEIYQARERIAADLKSIAGVKRVYDTIADLIPESPDCPCFELATRDPFFSVRGGAVGQTEDTLNFEAAFLLKPYALGKATEAMKEVDTFLMLTKQKLYANFTGAGLYLINKDTGTLDFSPYLVSKANAAEGNKFWGFTFTLSATMFNATTMSAGT